MNDNSAETHNRQFSNHTFLRAPLREDSSTSSRFRYVRGCNRATLLSLLYRQRTALDLFSCRRIHFALAESEIEGFEMWS